VDELEQIYILLESFLGESKQGQYDAGTTQYQFNCPQCADEKGAIDNKYNLEVSLALDKLMYHCWSCGISGSLSKLIGIYGRRGDKKEYMQLIDSLRKSKLYDFTQFSGNTKSEIFKPVIELPKTFKKISLKTCPDSRVAKYLIGRGIDQNIIDKYNIGWTTWEEKLPGWKCRIVVPSYDEFGVLNFYTGRDYLPDNGYDRPKYKNCEADKKEIVFNEHLINWDSTIYLCEGIFDSLVFENAVPLMGKALNEEFYLYKQICSLATGNLVIVLDGDTKRSESLNLFKLFFDKFENRIYHIDLGTEECPYKDFSEIYENEGKEGMIKTFRKAKKYKETDLIGIW
jgi:hypothetical protein